MRVYVFVCICTGYIHHDIINFSFLESVEPLNRAAREDITGVADDVMSIYVLKRRLSRDWLPILGLLQESELVKRVPCKSDIQMNGNISAWM